MSVQRITQQLKRIFWALIALYGIGVTTFTVSQWTISSIARNCGR